MSFEILWSSSSLKKSEVVGCLMGFSLLVAFFFGPSLSGRIKFSRRPESVFAIITIVEKSPHLHTVIFGAGKEEVRIRSCSRN